MEELQRKSNIYELGHIYCHQSAGIQTSSGDRVLGKEQSSRNREIRIQRTGLGSEFFSFIIYSDIRLLGPSGGCTMRDKGGLK